MSFTERVFSLRIISERKRLSEKIDEYPAGQEGEKQ
jgi:hypothetical protein